MTVARGIAQAKTYSAALTALTVQLIIAAVFVGAYAPSWWWGLVFLIVWFFMMGLSRYLCLATVVGLSVSWAVLGYSIAADAGAGLFSILVAIIVFAIAYGTNAAGIIGFQHSVPDLGK